MTEKQNEIIGFIEKDVSRFQFPKRYEHTLSVLGECRYYAEKLGLDEDEKYTLFRSAILHDISKDLFEIKQRKICRKNGLVYRNSPVTHQDTGAYFAIEKYGEEIVDKDVFSAISKHTTGGEKMNACDMILFIADYTEPLRKYKNCIGSREYIHEKCEKIDKSNRECVMELLFEAVAKICRETIHYLEEIGADIDERTKKTYAMAIGALSKEK